MVIARRDSPRIGSGAAAAGGGSDAGPTERRKLAEGSAAASKALVLDHGLLVAASGCSPAE
jgi:hypothetical protein